MSPALEVRDVWRSLRGRPVLEGFSLTLPPGECRALVGLNGAGKTTALRVVLGILRPDRGSVAVLGHPLPSPDRAVWGRVGHLVETPFSYPELTARENIRAAASLHGADAAVADASLASFAERLGLTGWLDVPVRRPSLGTRQKVGLVAALAHRPRLAVLDEPSNGLDPLAVVGLRDVVAEVTAAGAAVLVTSHHFDELARIADRVDVLHRGRVVDTLTPDGPDLERRFFETVLAADAQEQS